MRFKHWLENENRMKLLILVHPDCCAELGEITAKEYEEYLIKFHNNFDYVITHAFYSSEDWIKDSIWSDEDKSAFLSLYKTIKEISDKFLYDSRDAYG